MVSPPRSQEKRWLTLPHFPLSVKTPPVSSLRTYSISKLTVVKKSAVALTWDLFLVTFLHFWAYKHGRLARNNNQDNNKQKLSAVNHLP